MNDVAIPVVDDDELADEALDRAEKPSSCVCGGLSGRMTLTRRDGE